VSCDFDFGRNVSCEESESTVNGQSQYCTGLIFHNFMPSPTDCRRTRYVFWMIVHRVRSFVRQTVTTKDLTILLNWQGMFTSRYWWPAYNLGIKGQAYCRPSSWRRRSPFSNISVSLDHFTAQRYASAVYVVIVSLRPSVCLSVTSRSSTQMAGYLGSHKQHHTIAQWL